MKIEKTVCDVKGCKSEDASHFSVFKERKPDGAGPMDNWYWVFDLCSDHQYKLLATILGAPNHYSAKQIVWDSLTSFEVVMRME